MTTLSTVIPLLMRVMICRNRNVTQTGKLKTIDFQPSALLGSVSGELGLRKYLESNGHQLVVTSSKDGEDSVLDQELHDAEIVISQPFWPAYMTAERIAKAKHLKMIVTAGIGSDHTDLQAAMDGGITVAEVIYSTATASPNTSL